MRKQDEFVSSILGYPKKDISEGEPDESGGPKEIWTHFWKLAELIICPYKSRFPEERRSIHKPLRILFFSPFPKMVTMVTKVTTIQCWMIIKE